MSQKRETLLPIEVAFICNDLKNINLYRVDGEKVYRDGEYIGEGYKTWTQNPNMVGYDIFFKPIKPVEYLTLNITIDKDGNILD